MNNQSDLKGLVPSVADKITPMLREMLASHGKNIHSYHVVGSALLPDYNPGISDINSVVVLHAMDLGFVEFLAPLGGKYGKKGIAAPLVMTPAYIADSLDAFPIEFLDFKLIHSTLYGEDIFSLLEPDSAHLRLQAEREIKTRQIGLRQGYISSLGKKEKLTAQLVRSFTGALPLFRAIILLLGKKPPVARPEVISLFTDCCGIEPEIFARLLKLKNREIKPEEQDLRELFEHYYRALDRVREIIDGLHS